MAKRDHGGKSAEAGSGSYWLYGTHAVRAALGNPRRTILKALFTETAWAELESANRADLRIEICNAAKFTQVVPSGAVHQGAALLCRPLPTLDLEEVLDSEVAGAGRFAVLDQITDPHNEGAILRSAAAFGFSGVVVQSRHSPPESGVLAKAASGALDQIPRIAVVNIARALEEMGRYGIWRVGLAADAAENISAALRGSKVAVVLGAEGTGLRRLVRERCDTTASIPMPGSVESLNVSNAAAIAFYECARVELRK